MGPHQCQTPEQGYETKNRFLNFSGNRLLDSLRSKLYIIRIGATIVPAGPNLVKREPWFVCGGLGTAVECRRILFLQSEISTVGSQSSPLISSFLEVPPASTAGNDIMKGTL